MKRRGIVGLAALALLAGCARPAEPTRWYALRSEPPQPVPPRPEGGAAMPVWEISRRIPLPGALDRDTLMVATGAATLEPLTGHRWAEPLRDSLPRLLVQDIALLRGPGSVWTAPAPPGVAVAQRLQLEVLALHADAQRRMLHLQAQWWLGEVRAGAPAPVMSSATIDVPITDGSVDALAAAHRVVIWRLAQRVVAGL